MSNSASPWQVRVSGAPTLSTPTQPDILPLLGDIARQLNSHDLDEALAGTLALIVAYAGAEAGHLLLLDGSDRIERQILVRRDSPPVVSHRADNVATGKGLAGWVLGTRQAALVADAAVDERWPMFPHDTQTVGSALCVPLIQRDQPAGAITLAHSQPRHFDGDHLALVAVIAGLVALAAHNARLSARVAGEQTLLDTAISGVQGAVVIADTQGVIRCTNAAGERALGSGPGGAVGKRLADAQSMPDALRRMIARVQLDGAARRDRIEWPDGSTFEVTLVSAPGVGMMILLHDTAHSKQPDWTKSEFVTMISHDLKSPLAVLYGYACILAEAPELLPHSREYVGAIIENADRMRDLIESLLDLAQIQAGMGGEVEPCDLIKLIGNTREMLERQAKDKQQTLAFELAPVSNVLGNPVRLTQVIHNLVGNAIKYTPPGGRIEVVTQQRADEICFYVKDTGPGIPPAAQARLFQQFYRVGGAAVGTEGTGLGLAIVKSIVESYGGHVWVESQAGQGSTFGFVLPTDRNRSTSQTKE